MKMSQSALQKLCREHELFSTPSLNETLYCNYQGFTSIAALESYTALKSLFLEGNSLLSLDGLPCLLELKCLYLQNNSLSSLKCLESLPNMEVLNVSSNELVSLDGIAPCEKLQTLICSNNQLDSLESLRELSSCTALSTLDLQNNKLEDTQVLEHLQRFPEMRSLYLRDNPFLEAVRNSRKSIIASMPVLAYLDDRPVFELERRCAEAWVRGGPQAESVAREQMQVEMAAKERANFDTMQAMRRESFRKRREALGLPPGDTDPFYDTLKDKDFDEGDIPEDEDPPELVAARARLAALSAAQPGQPEPAGNGKIDPKGAARRLEPSAEHDDIFATSAENRPEPKAECENSLAGAIDGQLLEEEALAIGSLDLDDNFEEIVPAGMSWEDELDQESEGPAGDIQLEVIGRGLDNLIQELRAVDASSSQQ